MEVFGRGYSQRNVESVERILLKVKVEGQVWVFIQDGRVCGEGLVEGCFLFYVFGLFMGNLFFVVVELYFKKLNFIFVSLFEIQQVWFDLLLVFIQERIKYGFKKFIFIWMFISRSGFQNVFWEILRQCLKFEFKLVVFFVSVGERFWS